VAIPENDGDDGALDDFGSIPPVGRRHYDHGFKSEERERAERSQSKGQQLYRNQSQFSIKHMGMEDKK